MLVANTMTASSAAHTRDRGYATFLASSHGVYDMRESVAANIGFIAIPIETVLRFVGTFSLA